MNQAPNQPMPYVGPRTQTCQRCGAVVSERDLIRATKNKLKATRSLLAAIRRLYAKRRTDQPIPPQSRHEVVHVLADFIEAVHAMIDRPQQGESKKP